MDTLLEIKKSVEINNSFNEKIILVVDDIQINYLLIKALMKPTGATVLWVNNGAKAVDVIDSGRKIDLIFMDYNMPEMNGHEATIRIKSKRKELPIISQTSYTHGPEFDKIKVMYDDILMKPLTSQILFNMLNKHIN
ncbi:MAG: response regulator [Bacteroidota bacterium]